MQLVKENNVRVHVGFACSAEAFECGVVREMSYIMREREREQNEAEAP